MSNVTLSKLISKKEISSLINDIISNMGSSVIVCDIDDKPLIDNPNKIQSCKFAVKLTGDTIGWVIGDEKAASIALLLSHLADKEFEKKTLAVETLEKYKEITLLYDVAEKITACLDLNEVVRLIVDEALKIIKANNVSLILLNEETGIFEIVYVYGNEYEQKMTIKPGVGIAGTVLITGKAEIVNDVTCDQRYVIGKNKISSVMCAPLKTRDKIIGVINISSNEPVTYAAGDLKLFSALSSQASIAIENARLYENLKETFLTTVHTLAETIEKRDPYTGGHTRRVMNYCRTIGKALGLQDKDMERLELAAILHDIGKIGVSDSILLKNGKLTDDEFEVIKKHTIYGEEILNYIKHLRNIIPGVKQHHERYDGKGYPNGLKGNEIDVTARIIAIADSFDAMTTDRPYRKGLSQKVAFEELKKNAGIQFDPEVVRAFLFSYEETLKGGKYA